MMSARLSPAAATATRISPGPGSGICSVPSESTSLSPLPTMRTARASMLAMLASDSRRAAYTECACRSVWNERGAREARGDDPVLLHQQLAGRALQLDVALVDELPAVRLVARQGVAVEAHGARAFGPRRDGAVERDVATHGAAHEQLQIGGQLLGRVGFVELRLAAGVWVAQVRELLQVIVEGAARVGEAEHVGLHALARTLLHCVDRRLVVGHHAAATATATTARVRLAVGREDHDLRAGHVIGAAGLDQVVVDPVERGTRGRVHTG